MIDSSMFDFMKPGYKKPLPGETDTRFNALDKKKTELEAAKKKLMDLWGIEKYVPPRGESVYGETGFWGSL